MYASAAMAYGVLTSCGGGEERKSARFVQTTTYYSPGEDPLEERVTGSFDWEALMGHATARGFGKTDRTIQMGGQCYRRYGGESWDNTSAEDPDGLCDAALFSDPNDELELLRQVASDFRSVGRGPVRGVDTTHYGGRLDMGGVRGRIDVWVDENGVVRRRRQSDGDTVDGFRTVREYFDLGLEVDVSVPVPFAGGG
jgi:hypothetical protein